jgi:CheY-like chemotaxis protein
MKMLLVRGGGQCRVSDVPKRFSPRSAVLPGTVAKNVPELGVPVRPPRIVVAEDEPWLGEMVDLLIQQQFGDVTILRFQHRNTAWQELLRASPDLLITDMNNNNVPGRVDYMGMSGWKMLPLLAEREVTYPILVMSGSFSMPGVESRARECAGPKLNIAFLTKPFAKDLFQQELVRLLSPSGTSGRRLPIGGP